MYSYFGHCDIRIRCYFDSYEIQLKKVHIFRFVQKKPSTTENLAVFIWQNLTKRMHRPDLLYEVKIQETDKNSVVFRGRTNGGHTNHSDRVRSSVSSDSD